MKCTGKEDCPCEIHETLRYLITEGEIMLKEYAKLKEELKKGR